MLVHPIPPVVPPDARILILGSFPSVKSRETGFYYGHPRNRFWRVLSSLYGEETPADTEEKKAFLYRHKIALWDVIGSCEIDGSSDASIRNAKANDIASLLGRAPIGRIFLNGAASAKYYHKYAESSVSIPAAVLPSTSPANAAWSEERLTENWRAILQGKEEEHDPS